MKNNETAHAYALAVNANLHQVQHFVQEKMADTKKELNAGLSFFKDELSEGFQKTTDYINSLVLPVNNFIKDITQMEREFEAERQKNSEYCLCLNGREVGVSEILQMNMEENY